MSRIVLLLLFCALANAFPTLNLNKTDISLFEDEEESRRLPNSTFPVVYELSIKTNFPQLDYSGTVRIEISVLEETNLLILNQREIDISEIVLSDNQGEIVELGVFTTDDDLGLLRIPTINPLIVGETYFLNIVFNSVLRTDNYGFYRTSYWVKEGDEELLRYLAATQFQPDRGSSAFPCYDEPRFRSRFDIKLTHRSTYHALGNMPGTTVEDPTEEGFSITTFERTPTIPTYLIAFVISNFDHISNAEIKDETDHHHRVFAEPSQIHKADFALKTGNDVINTLEQLFDMTYSLPKMDQIAIPNLAFGAMEHWGLVTYRPSYLLYEEGVSSEKNRQDVATIISHEFTHQFFGNSLTPYWWSYAWLNEGFATVYEFYLTDMLFPEMRLKEQFTVDILQSVFIVDAVPGIRSMTSFIDRNIHEILDSITYSKAGSVLRMMNYALHEETFVKGLTLYLNENIEGVSTPDLLNTYLQQAVTADSTLPEEISVADVMNSWSLQSGFPLLTVTRDYSSGSLSLYQQRFLSSPVVEEEIQTWWIPYNFASSNRRDFVNTNPSGWMELGVATKSIETNDEINWSSDDWIIFNVQQTGYYRVNYDNQNWRLIADELNHGDFEDIVPINRAQIIDDSLNLANVGKLDYEIALEVVSYLERETDIIPLRAASNNMNYLKRMFIGKEFFQNYIQKIFAAAYNKLGVDEIIDEPVTDKLLRPIIVNMFCSMGSDDCLTKTSEKLKAYIAADGVGIIEPDMKSSIFCNGLRKSGNEEFLYIFQKLHSLTDPVERNLIIDSLSCVEVVKIIEEFLWASFSNNFEDWSFLPGERLRIFLGIIGNGVIGLETAIDFIEKNHRELYNTDTSTVITVIGTMSGYIVNEDLATKYTNMIEVMSTGLEIELPDFSVISNLEWQTKHGEEIQTWIETFLRGTASTNFISMFCIILGVFVYIFNNN